MMAAPKLGVNLRIATPEVYSFQKTCSELTKKAPEERPVFFFYVGLEQFASFCDRLVCFVRVVAAAACLTHFSPMLHFYTSWKHQKAFGFLTDIFRGYRN